MRRRAMLALREYVIVAASVSVLCRARRSRRNDAIATAATKSARGRFIRWSVSGRRWSDLVEQPEQRLRERDVRGRG